MWVAIPSAKRRSKLLPWLQANTKEDEEQQVVTAFSISRERSQRKAFNKSSGMARLDELMGLAQARKVGFLGGLLTLLVLGVSWLSPLALPVYSVAVNGVEWYHMQEEVKSEAALYLGPLRAEKPAAGAAFEKEAEGGEVMPSPTWRVGRSDCKKDPNQASEYFRR